MSTTVFFSGCEVRTDKGGATAWCTSSDSDERSHGRELVWMRPLARTRPPGSGTGFFQPWEGLRERGVASGVSKMTRAEQGQMSNSSQFRCNQLAVGWSVGWSVGRSVGRMGWQLDGRLVGRAGWRSLGRAGRRAGGGRRGGRGSGWGGGQGAWVGEVSVTIMSVVERTREA